MSTDNNSNGNSKALAIVPKTVDDAKVLARLFAASSLLPADLRGKEPDIFVSIIAGQELGLAPMAALRGVHVVKGKPILSADTMVGVVLSSGAAEYFTCVNETTTSVTYETKRKGAPKSQQCTWTMDDAKRAGLNGDNWQKYPRAMLKARCKAMLARDVYPDVLAGCYTEDEAREFAPVPNGPQGVVDAEFTDLPANEQQAEGASLASRITAASTLDDLKALAPECNKIAKGSPERNHAMAAYKTREAALKQEAAKAAETGDAA